MNPRNLNNVARLTFLSSKLVSELNRLGRIWSEQSRQYASLAAALIAARGANQRGKRRIRRLRTYYENQSMLHRGKAEIVKRVLRSHGIKAHGFKLKERRAKR